MSTPGSKATRSSPVPEFHKYITDGIELYLPVMTGLVMSLEDPLDICPLHRAVPSLPEIPTPEP